MRNITVVAYSYTRLCKQSGGERVRMIERSALNVLLAGSLEASAFGASRYAKDWLIGKALHSPAEPEGVAVVIPAVEIEFAVECRSVFQEARSLLVVAGEAWSGYVGVRNERENRLRKLRDAVRRDNVIRKRRATCGGYWRWVWHHMRGVARIGVGIIDGAAYVAGGAGRRRDRLEISTAEVVARYRQVVKLAPGIVDSQDIAEKEKL